MYFHRTYIGDITSLPVNINEVIEYSYSKVNSRHL